LVSAELSDTTLLLDEEVVSASSGKIVHRIVVRKAPWQNDANRIPKKYPARAGGDRAGPYVR